MHITNQEFNQIMLNYRDNYLAHEAVHNEMKQKIYDENPTLNDMEFKLKKLRIKKVKLNIAGSDDTVYDKEIKLLDNEINKILSRYKTNKKDFEEFHLCRKCNDTGYVGNEMCVCFKKYVIDFIYKNSNLREKFLKENFDTFSFDYYSDEKLSSLPLSSKDNAKIIYGASRDYCNNFDKMLDKNYDEKFNLLFYGMPGLGKTFICNCIAKDILDRCYSVIYYSSCELSKLVVANAFNEGKNQDEAIRDNMLNVYDCDLLILDDLGTESNNQLFMTELFNIINDRMISHRPTIISTNLNMDDIRDKYTERISSRFIEGYEIFKFFGNNIREIKNNK